MVTIKTYSFPSNNDIQAYKVPYLYCAATVKATQLWQALRFAKTNPQESIEQI